MKKTKQVAVAELRREYKREDFGALVRGKYSTRLKVPSNIVVLRPEAAKVFPNADAVNEALLALINLAKASARSTNRSSKSRAKDV